MKNKKIWILFALAIVIRFVGFPGNTYFGFDEARDAFVAKSIYTDRSLKLIGPPASGDIGLFHGPLYWYLVGPIYLLFSGDIFLMSALFRIINASGIFLIYTIANAFFGIPIALISSLLYVVSFEQNQYSLYIGKESLAVLSWLGIILGIVWIYKDDKRKVYSLPMIFGLYGIMVQFNLIYAALALPIFALLMVVSKKVAKLPKSTFLFSTLTFFVTISTYILAEIKYNFRSIRTAVNLIDKGFGVMGPGQTKYTLFWDKLITMFRDNLIGLSIDNFLLITISISFLTWVAIKAYKMVEFRIILIWILGGVGLMFVGGHMAYYTNAGFGVGIIIATSYALFGIRGKNKLVTIGVLVAIVASNSWLISKQIGMGLVTGFKPQPYMNLTDEISVIDQMYKTAGGNGFTVRLTGIPYIVQTVWAYLFDQYGYKRYGYYPYWETGNTLGYPGVLPVPTNGTTCIRFWIREPNRGLPEILVTNDISTENSFSEVVSANEIGKFVIQTRKSIDKNCHNQKADKN